MDNEVGEDKINRMAKELTEVIVNMMIDCVGGGVKDSVEILEVGKEAVRMRRVLAIWVDLIMKMDLACGHQLCCICSI
jgi:hypothetical protein